VRRKPWRKARLSAYHIILFVSKLQLHHFNKPSATAELRLLAPDPRQHFKKIAAPKNFYLAPQRSSYKN
jgi:hypothetical protein